MGYPYPYKEQAKYDRALRGDQPLPPKPKYKRWQQLQSFAAHHLRFSFFLGLTMGLFHSVPRENPPKAFSELLRRDLVFYKHYQGPDGQMRMGLSPTVGYSRGSAVVYALCGRQIEEFHSPWHTESHDQARDRLYDELSAAGYSTRREQTLTFTRQRKKKRIKMKARWDLHMPEQDLVVEIESGMNKSSQVQRHIESCLAEHKDLTVYIPRITSQEPRPVEGTRTDLEDLKKIVRAERELKKAEQNILKYSKSEREERERALAFAKADSYRRFLRERTRAGKVWPLEISGAEREQASRYINFLTQILWRTLLSARRLPNVSVDFCYSGQLLRSIEVRRGKIYLTHDRAEVRQPLVKTGDHPVTSIDNGKEVEKEAEHFFKPKTLQTLVEVGVRGRIYAYQ